MTTIKKTVLILTIAALRCTSLVAITKAPAKTDDQYFVLNCSDGKKIPNVQYQVLAQSTVLKKVAENPQLQNKTIFLPNIDHPTMMILLTCMTIVCNEHKESDIIKTIQTIQKTFIDDQCIHSFLDDDNQTVLDVYNAANILDCSLIKNAFAQIISQIFHSQTLPHAPLDNASNPKQLEDLVAFSDEFVQYFEQSNNQYASFAGNDPNDLIDFTYDPQAYPLQEYGVRENPNDNLTTPIQSHTGKKCVKCPFDGCSKYLTRKSNLAQHIRTHTGEKPFICTFDGCSKSFARKSSLIGHIRTHTGEKPFICTFPNCNKAYSQKSHLIKHTQTHNDEKLFQCTFLDCDKVFSQKGDLTIHIRTHTGARLFQCTFDGCNKVFSQKGNLTIHTRTHTGERPFQCTLDGCNKAFTKKSVLITHIRTHTGEKPYQCTFDGCNKRFTQTGNLTQHIQTHKK